MSACERKSGSNDKSKQRTNTKHSDCVCCSVDDEDGALDVLNLNLTIPFVFQIILQLISHSCIRVSEECPREETVSDDGRDSRCDRETLVNHEKRLM